MTQGLDLLCKIVVEQTLQGFRETRQEWFVDDELRLYEFIQGYLNRYSRLPDQSVLVQNGYNLPFTLSQPLQYYQDQLSSRYIMVKAVEEINRLNEAIQYGDVNRVRMAQMELGQALALGNSNVQLTTLREQAQAALDRSRAALYTQLIGYPTGWGVLNGLTGGWQRQDVNVIVGRPGTGKTMILLKSIYESWSQGNSALIVSLEMSGIQMATRSLCLMSGHDPKQFKTGEISSWARRQMQEVISSMDDNFPPMHMMVAETRKTLDDVEAAIDRIDPAVIYIDAGYLLTTGQRGGYQRSRRETIADVIESLKGLAIRTNKPIVTTVQFNRNVKTNKKKNDKTNDEMSIEDIGETDVIGQIASTVLGIHPPKPGPVGERTRILQLLKNRDDQLIKFKTNFLFRPPNFDYIETVYDNVAATDTESENAGVAQQLQNMGWM